MSPSFIARWCALAGETVERYLFLLEQTYILKLVRQFSRSLRSGVTKTPQIFFVDTGLIRILWLKRLQREALGSVIETAFSENCSKNKMLKIFAAGGHRTRRK